MKNNWLNKYQDGGEINFKGVKQAVRNVESLDGKLMWNPESTATGFYGQRFSEIKDDYKGTRKDFVKDTIAQNKYFKDRFYKGIEASETTPLQKDANDLYEEYSPQIDNFNYSKEDIAVLSNFLGRDGARQYFGYHIRDGKPLDKVFPKLYGKGKQQTNKTPEEYFKQARPFYKNQTGGVTELQRVTPIQIGIQNWNKARLATGRFDDQLGNGELEKQWQNMLTTKIITRDEYLKDIDPDLGPAAGAYSPEDHVMFSDPGLIHRTMDKLRNRGGTILHETAHSARALPQVNKIEEVIKTKTPDPYFNNPEETYSKLMELRLDNNVDPNKVWYKKDIPELRKMTDRTEVFLDYYTDDELLDLMNKVATNVSKNNNSIAKNGIIQDDRGQWAHPGKITKINSNNITMQGVNYPVLGISNTGDEQLMMPGEDYKFDGDSVTEFPMAQKGMNVEGQNQKKWFDSYIRSDKYLERLGKEFPEYSADELANERSVRLMNMRNTSIGFLPESSNISPDPDSTQGVYNADEYPGKIMLRPEYSQGRQGPWSYNTIPLHEMGHAVDEGGKRIPQTTLDFLMPKLKQNSYNIPKEKYYYTDPTEYINRLQPVRYLLQEEGIYDAKKKDFTKENLQKAKENTRIKYNTHFKDLMKNTESEEDFIKIMNTIADNPQMQQNTKVAQNGKELVKLDQLTNFTNYNTPQPGGWLNKYQ